MIDKKSGVPIYLQLKQYIRQMVRDAPEDKTNQALFKEEALAKQFGVNRHTVRQAVTELVNEGVLYRVRGVGTFVAPPKLQGQLKDIERFLEEWRGQQQEPRSEILFFGWVSTPTLFASRLQVAPNDHTLCFRRRRFVQGQPLAIDLRYVAPYYGRMLTAEDVVNHPAIDTIVRRTRYGIQTVDMALEAIAAAGDESEWLEVPDHAPLLRRTITIYLTSGEPVITGWSIYRGDRYQYHVVLPST